MKRTGNQIPDWIEKQATLGPNIEVDGELTDQNSFWYLLTVCCPLIFESYAIVLHPFWINWKVKELIESGLKLKEEQVSDEDFERLSWKEFFKLFNKSFKLETANETRLQIKKEVQKDEWPIYLWYPGEGNCETPELNFIINTLIKLFGDEEVYYYYCLLKTKEWKEEKIYQGKLSEFNNLGLEEDIFDNPTAIYPEHKKWCIVSDYDLDFTYVGGTEAFINSITDKSDFDIYELTPTFKRK